ncbi:MAG: hypothetical protein PHH26_08330 [Candidatus Thermoplasmatota archaeon]|nr:hypothetical protein [Candidatus Thermoplasmatota archaeon]
MKQILVLCLMVMLVAGGFAGCVGEKKTEVQNTPQQEQTIQNPVNETAPANETIVQEPEQKIINKTAVYYFHNPGGQAQGGGTAPAPIMYAPVVGTMDENTTFNAEPQKDYSANGAYGPALVGQTGSFSTAPLIEAVKLDVSKSVHAVVFLGADQAAPTVAQVKIKLELKMGDTIIGVGRGYSQGLSSGGSEKVEFDIKWAEGFDGAVEAEEILTASVWLASSGPWTQMWDESAPDVPDPTGTGLVGAPSIGSACVGPHQIYDHKDFPASITITRL